MVLNSSRYSIRKYDFSVSAVSLTPRRPFFMVKNSIFLNLLMLVLHSYTLLCIFFCLVVSLKATKNLKKKTVGLRGVIIDSAVTLTPWRPPPRGQWHRGDHIIFLPDRLRGVNDTVETASAVSLTPWRPYNVLLFSRPPLQQSEFPPVHFLFKISLIDSIILHCLQIAITNIRTWH